MILVTGGAGFIGSNLVKILNLAGVTDIIICDNLEKGQKLLNLVDLKYETFVHKADLFNFLQDSKLELSTVFHLGACSATTEWNGNYLMSNNVEFSVKLSNVRVICICVRFGGKWI